MSIERKKEALIFSKARDPHFYIKTIRGENGILARIFLEILIKLRIDPLMIGKLLGDYVSNPLFVKENTNKKRVSAKGNLVKELGKNSMSWKVFMKALRFVQIKRFKIIFIGWTTANDPVKISIAIPLSDDPIRHKAIPFDNDYAPPEFENENFQPNQSTGIRPEFITPSAQPLSGNPKNYQKTTRE